MPVHPTPQVAEGAASGSDAGRRFCARVPDQRVPRGQQIAHGVADDQGVAARYATAPDNAAESTQSKSTLGYGVPSAALRYCVRRLPNVVVSTLRRGRRHDPAVVWG